MIAFHSPNCSPVDLWLAATVLTVALSGFGCQQRPAVEAESATSASQSPLEILRQMAETYRDAKSYEDVGELHVESSGSREDEPKPFAVALERPNKIRVHSLAAMVVADGQEFRACTPSLDEQVFVQPCPERLTLAEFSADAMLEQTMRGQLDAALPQMALLLDGDWLATLTADNVLEQLPDADFQGETFHRVAAKGPQGTAVYWISPRSHLLRKFEFPMAAIREKFPLDSVWVDFRGARVNTSISPLAFQMEIPPGAKLVKRFILPRPDAPPRLLSQPAGNFTFIDFQGAPVSRESLAGKVVVLDMWATWCGWCFEGLPLLETVYQRYKDNPQVVILAVCKDETAVSDGKVRSAFENHKLTIPIVRDLQQVSDSVFEVQALPTSVVLGMDGSVQDYHVGYDPQLVTTLPQKIEKLLAGENLAEQELEAYRREQHAYEQRLAEVLVDAGDAAPGEAAEVARKNSAAK